MAYSPPFTKTSKIDELAFEIVELVGEFKVASGIDAKPWLHRAMRIKTVHSSLAIEGNELGEREVQGIIDGQRVQGDPQDILEVQNAIAAYELLDELDPFSIEDLLKVHGCMMRGLVREAGRFRLGNVGVYDGDVLIHAGTPANYVPEVMGDLFDWIEKTDLHPLVYSCVFHYEFEFVHPFADGNGRCGRLWHTLLLAKWREMFKWLPVESAIFSRQKEYYDALALSDNRGSSEPFVELMLEIIRDSVARWLRPESKRTQQEVDALNLFKNSPQATVDDLAKVLEVSPRTAARIVKDLKAAGWLRRTGPNKTGHWECVFAAGKDGLPRW